MGFENTHGYAQSTENDFGFYFLKQYHKNRDAFLNGAARVTGDGTWVSYRNVENKEKEKHWVHTYTPNKPGKSLNKLRLLARKLMATVS
jgi:hypothetical protein